METAQDKKHLTINPDSDLCLDPRDSPTWGRRELIEASCPLISTFVQTTQNNTKQFFLKEHKATAESVKLVEGLPTMPEDLDSIPSSSVVRHSGSYL